MEKTKKYSYKRSLIYSTMKETKIHPSAEWVYQEIKPRIPNISIGTVYRNIAAFKEEGMIVSVGVVNGQERYDADISPHMHFICELCDSVTDIGPLAHSEEMCRDIEEKIGAQVHSTNIVYKGLCRKCAQLGTKNIQS